MPLVQIRYKPDRIKDWAIGFLAKDILPLTVAHALNIENVAEARLTHDDVEVHVDTVGQYDVQKYDIAIVVFANAYKERKAKLRAATEEIKQGVNEFLQSHSLAAFDATGFVYVILVSAHFAEFVSPRKINARG